MPLPIPETYLSGRFPSAYRELDSRESDGITVSLYWRERDGSLLLEVDDFRAPSESFSAIVRGEDASYAFRHPYAWLAERSASTARVFAQGV